VARHHARRDDDNVETDFAVGVIGGRARRSSAAPTIRRLLRSVTPSTASSTQTRTPPRLATMSISPNGVFQRRAGMR